jgi:hypothetical protein
MAERGPPSPGTRHERDGCADARQRAGAECDSERDAKRSWGSHCIGEASPRAPRSVTTVRDGRRDRYAWRRIVSLEFLSTRIFNDRNKNFILLTPEYRYSFKAG